MPLKMKYFVLNPESMDPDFADASQMAMRAFAEAIKDRDRELADSLDDWVDSIVFDKPEPANDQD